MTKTLLAALALGLASCAVGPNYKQPDTADITHWWAGEAEPDADSTNTALGEYAIPLDEMRLQPKVSLRLLSDAAINVEAWLADKIADRVARGENATFVTGTFGSAAAGLMRSRRSAS